MFVKDLPLEKQTRVLWLHNQAFGGDTACKQCPGNCCGGCAGSGGYRPYDEPNEVFAERKRKYDWDDKRGFKGEHGCKLPLTERSDVCVSYYCSGVNKNLSGDLGMMPPLGVDKPFTKERRQNVQRMRNVLYGYEEDRYL